MCYGGLHLELSALHICQLTNLTNIILLFGQADIASEAGEVLNKILYRGSSVPQSNPLPFYIPFWTEKVPLSSLSHTQFRTLHPLINALSRSQCRRHVALGTGDRQVNHSEALGGQQDSMALLKSVQTDYLQHLR